MVFLIHAEHLDISNCMASSRRGNSKVEIVWQEETVTRWAHYPDICRKRLENTMNNLSTKCRPSSLNTGSSEYVERVLIAGPRYYLFHPLKKKKISEIFVVNKTYVWERDEVNIYAFVQYDVVINVNSIRRINIKSELSFMSLVLPRRL